MSLSVFNIGITADFYNDDETLKFADIGLGVLDECDHINVFRFEQHDAVISSGQLSGCHGVIVLTPQVTADSLLNSEDLLCIGRFGVGFDSVDVDACTSKDVLVTITAGAVDRSMAEATIGWMIALTHQMLIKDQLVRSGNWDQRTDHNGCELRDRTLGVIGLGGIGKELVAMLRGFGMQTPLAYDPFVPSGVLQELGVESVSLADLMRRADFVSVHCPLNEQTKGLVSAEMLALMQPSAYLLNTARGGIVDEDALFEALQQNRIAGAALDCFEDEPVTSPHRFGTLNNVILAPHSIAWTEEFFRDIGTMACQNMQALSRHQRPTGVLNPELFDRPSFQRKWRRVLASSG